MTIETHLMEKTKFVNWIKFFGLGFFSHKKASEAPTYGFTCAFVSIALSFLFVMFGYYGASVAPFSTHYDNASGYRAFIDSAFDGIELSIENGVGKSDRQINTYTSDADKAAYALNGYDLIVDTRPSDTLVAFECVAIKGDEKLGYEEYLELSSAKRSDYKLAVECSSAEALVITDEDVEKYEAYFASVSDEAAEKYNKSAVESYAELIRKASMAAEEYRKELYFLYVQNYYPKVRSVYEGAKAPVLRDYYYANYINKDTAYYLFVLDDMIAGSFETDKGVPMVFGGYFDNSANGAVTDIHSLIKQTYYDTASYTFVSYFVSAMMQLPTIVFIPLILAFVMWGANKLIKRGTEQRFGGCYKTVAAFVWVSALLSSLAVFIGGFLTAARTMYKFFPLIFGLILLIRAIVHNVIMVVKTNSELCRNELQTNNNDNIFGGIA